MSGCAQCGETVERRASHGPAVLPSTDPTAPLWSPEHGIFCPAGGSHVVTTLACVPLSDEQARELSRAAKNVTTWTDKRNEAIRAAREAGGGIREIARATGLNVATVHNIIKPRSRRG